MPQEYWYTIPITFSDLCALTALDAQVQARTELRAQLQLAPFEGNLDVAKVDLLDWEEMTNDQKLARGMLQRCSWLLLENTLQQINLGLLPDEVQEQSLV